jgi:hypothetical protein
MNFTFIFYYGICGILRDVKFSMETKKRMWTLHYRNRKESKKLVAKALDNLGFVQTTRIA